jgi:hypothetical protein
MLFAALYDKNDFLNVVTDFTIERQNDGSKKPNRKARKKPAAILDARDSRQRRTAKCDADITSWFCLLESDDLPFDFNCRRALPLPIVAIIDSAGRSAHAWVMLDCSRAEEYRTKVNRIFTLLSRFRVCQSNKPIAPIAPAGRATLIGKRDAGAQRLLYLNPDPTESPIFERSRSR